MSDDKRVKIVWEVEDGYVSGRRPHTIFFDREDWDSMTEDERDEAVYEQAMQSISVSWKEA